MTTETMAGGEQVVANVAAAPPQPSHLPRQPIPPRTAAAIAAANDAIAALESPLDVLGMLRERRLALYSELAKIDVQIRALGAALPDDSRAWWHCLRCGWDWQSYSTGIPRACARCHSIGWNTEPVLKTARRPEDPPAKSWKVRKARQARKYMTDPIAWPALTVPTTADLRVQPIDGLPPPPRASAFAPRSVTPIAPPSGPLAAKLAEIIAPAIIPAVESDTQVDDLTADAYPVDDPPEEATNA